LQACSYHNLAFHCLPISSDWLILLHFLHLV
jgi:hypothetical protein